MGNWYRDNLGFSILWQGGNDAEGVSFIADNDGTVLELGKIPQEGGPPLDAAALEPLQLHIALECDNPTAETKRLVSAGATLIGESPRNSYQGEKILVRDPWGFVIQLINRATKLEEIDG
jgi:catechol 2,3-dioxygenase-like lactoylglutathione lyase family enzyme